MMLRFLGFDLFPILFHHEEPAQPKQAKRYVTTESLQFDVELVQTETRSGVEIYCLGFDANTGENKPSWNGYYPANTLYQFDLKRELTV